MSGRRPAVFSKVAEWRRDEILEAQRAAGESPDLASGCGVWVAFDTGEVSFHQFDGKDTHAGIFDAGYVLRTWRRYLEEEPAAWLIPHLEALERGDDVRREGPRRLPRPTRSGAPDRRMVMGSTDAGSSPVCRRIRSGGPVPCQHRRGRCTVEA